MRSSFFALTYVKVAEKASNQADNVTALPGTSADDVTALPGTSADGESLARGDQFSC